MTKIGSLTNIPESTTVIKEMEWADWLRQRSYAPYLRVEVASHLGHMNWDQGGGCST